MNVSTRSVVISIDEYDALRQTKKDFENGKFQFVATIHRNGWGYCSTSCETSRMPAEILEGVKKEVEKVSKENVKSLADMSEKLDRKFNKIQCASLFKRLKYLFTSNL